MAANLEFRWNLDRRADHCETMSSRRKTFFSSPTATVGRDRAGFLRLSDIRCNAGHGIGTFSIRITKCDRLDEII